LTAISRKCCEKGRFGCKTSAGRSKGRDAPVLPPTDYLAIHHRLRDLWLHAPEVFRVLKPADQWHLHAYFQPAYDLADTELRQYRTEITKRQPHLPRQAGHALSKLQDRLSSAQFRTIAPVGKPARGLTSWKQIKTSSVVNPDLDAQALFNVLMDIAEGNDDTDGPLAMDEDDLLSV
jgi:hypothetical protein